MTPEQLQQAQALIKKYKGLFCVQGWESLHVHDNRLLIQEKNPSLEKHGKIIEAEGLILCAMLDAPILLALLELAINDAQKWKLMIFDPDILNPVRETERYNDFEYKVGDKVEILDNGHPVGRSGVIVSIVRADYDNDIWPFVIRLDDHVLDSEAERYRLFSDDKNFRPIQKPTKKEKEDRKTGIKRKNQVINPIKFLSWRPF